MSTRPRNALVVSALACGLSTLVVPAATAAPAPGSPDVIAQHVVDDTPDPAAYWTPQRLAAATPDAVPAGGTSTGSVGNDQPQVLSQPAAPDTDSPELAGKHFDGVPEVGTLAHTTDGSDHYCSASVITSRHENLIITAAHCVYGSKNIVFIPKYHKGVRPYGTWTASTVYVDPRWAKNRDQDLDFAFVVIEPQHGRQIQQVVGSNGLAINRGFVNRVTVIGYPDTKYDSTNLPIWCTNTTSRFENYRYQVEFDCDNYPGGTSGSPWLLDYDPKTGRGLTNGVIGGYDEGGPNNNVSTTSYFDHDIAHLFADAQR